MTTAIGIHDLSFATTHYVLEHAALAEAQGTDGAKYRSGIGQEAMSIPALDEDIVTLAASAAAPILARHGRAEPSTVLLATESGVDQSKSAGLYLHSLLDLPRCTRMVELKQACYAATAALQFAVGLVARDPAQQILVIATDIARYDLDTPAEATQGAGAVAFLVAADPAIAALDPVSGLYSDDVNDFWRPNYRGTPIVDGKLSVHAYLTATEHAFAHYRSGGGRDLDRFAAFCYHQPFTEMAYKAHRHLLESQGEVATREALAEKLASTTHYNRVIGNSYTASLYLALASVLDHGGDLTGKPVAMLSYGSGAVAEFFSAVPVPGYRRQLRTTDNRQTIDARKPVGYHRYRELYHAYSALGKGGDRTLPVETGAPFRLAAIDGHQRIYEAR
ncbi:hydroxymethylglutaryl-CoA synthase [Nocardia grenadensis]|uniref:hydroxymethylglutaryl-CoA synthase n=1 Tax=Nocardia grenadensis TaxID=931537 RepID=UPI003D758E1F